MHYYRLVFIMCFKYQLCTIQAFNCLSDFNKFNSIKGYSKGY